VNLAGRIVGFEDEVEKKKVGDQGDMNIHVCDECIYKGREEEGTRLYIPTYRPLQWNLHKTQKNYSDWLSDPSPIVPFPVLSVWCYIGESELVPQVGQGSGARA
jgi:hypothetical protein